MNVGLRVFSDTVVMFVKNIGEQEIFFDSYNFYFEDSGEE